jgi:hypothetical protein
MFNDKFRNNHTISNKRRVLFCKSCGMPIARDGMCGYRCDWDRTLPNLRAPSSMAYLVYESIERFVEEEPYVRTIV